MHSAMLSNSVVRKIGASTSAGSIVIKWIVCQLLPNGGTGTPRQDTIQLYTKNDS
jgi:hypothetical protein